MLHLRRRSAVLTFAILVLSACVADAPRESGHVQIGVEYRYDLYDHCGLDTVPIVVDGSEWHIEGDTGGANPPPGFGNPVDEGTIRLDSPDRGIYRSSGGVERTIVRLGPHIPPPSGYLVRCI